MNEYSLALLLASLFCWWAKSGSPSPRDLCYSNPVLAPVAAPADGDGPQDSGTDTDSDIILDGGMAFLEPTGAESPPTGGTEGNLVIEHHIIANDRCFSYDDAGSMV